MKTLSFFWVIFLIYSFFSTLVHAQTNDIFSEMKKASPLVGASWSACIWKIGDEKPIHVKDDHLSLATGSVMKVLTTASALEILGEDYVFKTSIAYTGEVKEGVLAGDLWIIGGGDPDLGYPAWEGTFQKWYQAIDALGIKKVLGGVKVYAGHFESQMVSNTAVWEDIGNYFGSGVAGLNFHRNEYKLVFEPQKVGGLAKVLRTEPHIDGITFFNEMKTGAVGSGDQGYIYGAPYSNVRYLRGSVPAGNTSFSIKGSMPNPSFTCASLFKDFLKEKGLQVQAAIEVAFEMPDRVQWVETSSSRPISKMIKETNGKSINIQADALFKEMSFVSNGKKGSFEGGAQAVINYWTNRGVDLKGVHLEDGSGLSRYNAISARQLSEVLLKMYKGDHKETFVHSLAVAGTSGTLKYFGRNSTIVGHFKGKSGYIKRVRAIAGYLLTGADEYVVVVLINNFEGKTRAVDNEIVKVLETVMKP